MKARNAVLLEMKLERPEAEKISTDTIAWFDASSECFGS
jgi:hypothetical protein